MLNFFVNIKNARYAALSSHFAGQKFSVRAHINIGDNMIKNIRIAVSSEGKSIIDSLSLTDKAKIVVEIKILKGLVYVKIIQKYGDSTRERGAYIQ